MAESTLTELMQEVADSRIDMQSFESFMFEPANVMVPRRLAPDIHSFQHYLDYFNAIKLVFAQDGGTVIVDGVEVTSIQQLIDDALVTIANSGGRLGYETYAKMEAAAALPDGDLLKLPVNSVIEITNDTTANNGIYLYDGTSFIKALYESTSTALTTAKNYTDTEVQKVAEHDSGTNHVTVKDNDGQEVASLRANGGLRLPRITGDVQDAINLALSYAEYDSNDKDLVNITSLNSLNLLSFDRDGNIFAPKMAGSIQSNLLKLATAIEANLPNATVSQPTIVGKAVYAELPDGYTAANYRWYKDGEPLPSTKSNYTLTASDLYSEITVDALGVTGKRDILDNSGVTIGGVAIDALGAVGSIYEGFKLSAGDDFNSLDIIAPHKPLGKWFTTRTYLAGARGSDTLLGTMYDTDPYHVGFNDSNRGVPVGYDNMFVKNSVLTLNARAATAEEKKHFQGSTRNELASMISSAGAFSMYIGAGAEGENILEFRVRHSLRDQNPAGWHPSLWTQSSLPTVTYNSNEWDIAEGTHFDSATNYNEWGADGSKTGGVAYGKSFTIYDELWHTVTAKFNEGKLTIYLDGEIVKEIVAPTNSFNEPAYALISNHIYNGGYLGSVYSKAEWDRLIKGATIEVDFIRLWRKASRDHIKPITTIPPVNIEYGATGTLTLPSMLDLWGRTDVLEHVQSVMTEENEPSGHHFWAYNSLPSGVTYDSVTRTITMNTAGEKSGRLNFVIYGYKQDGSTCEPARTYVNVAPNIIVNNINLPQNSKYDLYKSCDCGVLVTDGVKRTKKITVSGMPVGALYDDETGFMYTNKAALGTYPITITCTNSVNQRTTKSVILYII